MQQPMIIISKHSVILTPEAIEMWWILASSFVSKGQGQIEAFHQFRVPDEQREIDEIEKLERQVSRVEGLLSQLEPLRGQVSRIFEQDFYTYAEVFRQTRIHAGLARFEDDAVLKLAVLLAMEELKQRNTYFSNEKFINYINNGGK